MRTASKPTSRKAATVHAVAVEIFCPECPVGSEPIPEPNTASLMWDYIPEVATCNGCGGTFRVSKKITAN